MKVAMLWLAIAATASLGCSASEPVTVGVFIDWWEAFNEDLSDPSDTYEELHRFATETLGEVKRVNPPEEVKEYHDVQTKGLEVFLDLAENKRNDTMSDAWRFRVLSQVP